MTETGLTLASWNIHMGIGSDGNRDMARTCGVINSLGGDVIGLQEVDNHHSDGGNDLVLLADRTGLTVIPGPTMQNETGDYGNALLTRLPVARVIRHDISFGHYEPRGLLIADLRHGGGLIRVAVTHLGLRPAERRDQVRKLMERLPTADDVPLILMGDFNEWLFWGRPLRWLHRYFGRTSSPATFPARWPLLALDQILAQPPTLIRNRRVFRTAQARRASDHLPLLADLRFPR